MMGHKKGPAGGDSGDRGNCSRWHTNNPVPNNQGAITRQEPIRDLTGRPGLSPARHLATPQRGEKSDTYPTIAVLNDRWRVIACKNSIQWILQKRSGPNHWRGRYFCRTRDALICCAREHAGETGGDALEILL